MWLRTEAASALCYGAPGGRRARWSLYSVLYESDDLGQVETPCLQSAEGRKW